MVNLAMGYSVKQCEALPVADTLAELWRRNLHIPADIDLQERVRWAYRDGPAGAGRVQLLVAGGPGGEAVVGCAGIVVRQFSVAGRPVPLQAALLGDLAVDRSHRTLLPALTLVRATRATALEQAIVYGYPNATSAPVLQRVGYRKLGTLTRWVRVLRHAPYIEREVKRPWLARAAGALLDGARLLQAAAARGPLVLEPLDDVDERLDRMWDEARGPWGVIGRRDAAYLRWRFLHQPGGRYQLIALSERGTRRVRAYAVLEQIEHAFHLRDFFGVSLLDVGALLDRLVPYCYRRGGVSLSVAFLGAPSVERLLREHHFHAREATRTVVVDGEAAAPPAAEWYLTDGDEDW